MREAVTNIYGSDGNMGSALGDQFTDQGALAGMKGTTPLTDLSADFKARLDALNPDLGGTYNYAGESYDAVVLVALAAQAAGTNDATVFAPYINGLTIGWRHLHRLRQLRGDPRGRRRRRLRRRVRPAQLLRPGRARRGQLRSAAVR